VSGLNLKETNAVKKAVEKRGFRVVAVAHSSSNSVSMAVSMTQSLLRKLSATKKRPYNSGSNVEKVAFLPDSLLNSLESIKLLERMLTSHENFLTTHAPSVKVWLAHDSELLSKLRWNHLKTFSINLHRIIQVCSVGAIIDKFQNHEVDEIARYFGPKIAIYFAFLRMYTSLLLIPAITGCLLSAWLWYHNAGDSLLLPLFGVLVAVWSTAVILVWKRRNADVVFR